MSLELLFLMLCSLNFFELVPFEPFFGGNNGFTLFLVTMGLMYIKYMGFTFRGGIKKHLTPLAWLSLGMLLSFIPASLCYGQHFYVSLLTYRRFYCYLLFPLLLSIQPSLEEIRQSLYWFCFLYLFFALAVTFKFPGWVVLRDNVQLVQEGEFIHVLVGERFVILALVFALDDLRIKKTRKCMYLVLFILVLLFLIQNRTALFSTALILILAVLSNRSARTRLIAEGLMLLLLLTVVVFTMNYIEVMVSETMEQLSDPDYNRIKALMYFISPDRPKFTYILGNGFISGEVHPLTFMLQEEGIFHSDMGLIGMWNQFGIIPVLTILVVAVRGFGRSHSFIVRAIALFILSSSLTLGYYMLLQCIVVLCLYLYCYSTDDAYFSAMELRRKERIQKAMKRFRSLAR